MSARPLLALTLLAGVAAAPAAPSAPRGVTPAVLAETCAGRDGWADPAPAAHIFGNTWYVGTCGITALLVTSAKGHVLIDTGLGEAASAVAANIERLGFRLKDVRWIVSSHEHFDHAEGHGELKRLTGARIAALPAAAAVLASGKPDPADPQAAHLKDMAPVRVDRVLRDGEVLAIGPLRLTAHATPAHSPGSTSWSWKSCEGRVCRTMTYADSATTISADGYRFTDHPERIAEVRRALAAIAALPCGILMTPHPSASNMFERFGTGQLEDAGACKAYAIAAEARFEARLAAERAQ